MKRAAILTAMLVAALSATGQDKGTFKGASIAKSEHDGSSLALSDGSKFNVELSYRNISSQWAKGMRVSYRLSPDGRCSRYEVETGDSRNQYICVSLPLSHSGKDVIIQVVQMLTKNSIVTENSSFAWAMATVIPRSQGPSATGLGMSSGTSVSTEIIKIVGMDAILDGQKVRLQCGESSCHGLNANSYNSELKGADIWITSYGQRWDAKQEKLVQEEYSEHWKIVGAWE